MKILCVAEKPSIAKEVANILSGGRFSTRNSQNKYIKNYDFQFTFPGHGDCLVTMTSVVGHITNLDFPPAFQWGKCVPGRLLDAQLVETIQKKDVFDNISREATHAQKLMIWTDCDREGEFIGHEIFKAAHEGNQSILIGQVWRSRFSDLEKSHIIYAACNPVDLDLNAVEAVACRMEVDFRVGTSFTRLLTNSLRQHRVIENKQVASYGTCQFPTLGFVVDRYKRVKSFIPEKFWYISVDLRHDNKKVTFNWTRRHLFDKLFVLVLYQKCLEKDTCTVSRLVQTKTTSRKPLPLTTVELQKDCSRYFKMSAKRALDAAEKLYNKGFLSYPRTETDSYPQSMDFAASLANHTQDSRWGSYVLGLLQTGIDLPRSGSHDDKAHPAIHPVKYVNIDVLLSADEKKVYEYVTRRFIACCSMDAVGQLTSASIKWGDEFFTASGLMVTERNYLDVFIYRKWESSKQLPPFVEGSEIKVSSGLMKDGETSPPKHMTEFELIALMDANGIGTDATIADHIEKIIGRGYAAKQKQASVEVILPSPLGMGLIESFDQMEFDNISLSKPFLRKSLERSLQDIADGARLKSQVLSEVTLIYKRAYSVCSQSMEMVAMSCKSILQQ